MKKNKALKIALISAVVLILIVGVVYTKVILPRIVLQDAVDSYRRGIVPAEYILDFSNKPDDAVTVENDYFSVGISEDFTLNNADKELGVLSYKSNTNGDAIMICYEPNDMTKSLLDREMYKDDIVLEEAGIDNPEERVSLLCSVSPDSYYNTLKNAALLDSSNYDFWNLDKATAFYILGSIRESAYGGYIPYIYERDNVFAIISKPEKEGKGYIIDMVKADDLNSTYLIIYNTKYLDDVVALVNTLEFK